MLLLLLLLLSLGRGREIKLGKRAEKGGVEGG